MRLLLKNVRTRTIPYICIQCERGFLNVVHWGHGFLRRECYEFPEERVVGGYDDADGVPEVPHDISADTS